MNAVYCSKSLTAILQYVTHAVLTSFSTSCIKTGPAQKLHVRVKITGTGTRTGTRVNVNGCHWNTRKFVFTVTRTRTRINVNEALQRALQLC